MNRNVLVTGGAGGLGSCIVKQHLELGDTVWALDVKATPETEALTSNKRFHFVPCNISKTAFVQEALADKVDAIGKLDYVYSTAGIYRFEDRNMLPETNLDNAAIMYEINAVGFLRVMQVLLPLIHDAAIMCITSEAGSIGENWRSSEYNYCMSKAAENMACMILQHYLTHELKGKARIICLHPGWLRTQMGGKDALEHLEQSVAPEDSARSIIRIARDIDQIPEDVNYMDYRRKPIAW